MSFQKCENKVVSKTFFYHIIIFFITLIYFIPLLFNFHNNSLLITKFGLFSYGDAIAPNFLGLFILLSSILNLSVKLTYVLFLIIATFLSMEGSFIFLYYSILSITKNSFRLSHSFIFGLLMIFASMFFVFNTFIVNNFDMGPEFYPFFTLALGLVAFSIFHNINSKTKLIFIFSLSALITFQYYGYTLLPLYFDITYLLVFVPIFYFIKKLKWGLISIILSNIIFLVFSGAVSAFSIINGNTYALGNFPYFRPINLIEEHADLLVGSLQKLESITGLNFNLGFTNSILYIEILTLIILSIIIFLFIVKYILYGIDKKTTIFLIILFLLVLVAVPFYNGMNALAAFAISITKSHFVNYQHLGIVLTALNEGRIELFPFYTLVTLLIAISFSEIYNGSIKEDNTLNSIIKRKKYSVTAFISILIIVVLLFTSFSTTVGGYTYANIEKDSPTYAYAVHSNLPDDRTLLYTDPNMFYPGNFYPGQMEMQQDIPDLPMFENFVNMESSPLVNVVLNTMSPSDFIYRSGQEPFIGNYSTSHGYDIISNSPDNVTVGSPVFVLGSMETFDQFLLNNYYLKDKVTRYSAYENATVDYGRFSYYNISNTYLSYLDHKGGIVELNLNASLITNIKVNTGYTFGFSQTDGYYPSHDNNTPSIGISKISSISQALSMYDNDPASFQMVGSNYLNVANTMFSYDKQTNIPFNGPNFNVTMLLYGTGDNMIDGFVDYNGYWYQSDSPFSLDDVKYFYSQSYLDSPSNISYNFTISELSVNPLYRNIIPIYYDSLFGNLTNIKNIIQNSAFVITGKNYNNNDIIGSEIVSESNISKIEPSAYAIDYETNGWYQVFSGDPAQSALYGEDIPPVLNPDQVGYSDYYGYAQSFINGSVLKIPTKESGNMVMAMNILFSPAGGDIIITTGHNSYNISTVSNNPYYKWVFLNVNMDKSLEITNVHGIQSINDIAFMVASQLSYLKNFTSSILLGHNNTPTVTINVGIDQYKTSPVSFDNTFNVNNTKSFIVEYPDPLYTGFNTQVSNASYYSALSWGYFPSIIVYNIDSHNIGIKYYQMTNIINLIIPFIPFLAIPIIYFTPFIYRKIKKIRLVMQH